MEEIRLECDGEPFVLRLDGDYQDNEKSYFVIQSKSAIQYFKNQTWYKPVEEITLQYGIESVLCVFTIRFSSKIDETDDSLWYIGGDLPPAYLVPDEILDFEDALKEYVAIMWDWVNAVRTGSDIDNVFPVNAPPDMEYAEMLASRLNFISKEILS